MKSYKQTVCHRETIKWVKAVESVGIEYITIHGRRRTQRSTEPVNVEAIKLIKSSVTVPVVLNGDAFSIDDATRMIEATGVDGVMAARGLLPIPALFANYRKTPWGAVERFLDYNMRSPLAISTDIAPCIGDDGGYDI